MRLTLEDISGNNNRTPITSPALINIKNIFLKDGTLIALLEIRNRGQGSDESIATAYIEQASPSTSDEFSRQASQRLEQFDMRGVVFGEDKITQLESGMVIRQGTRSIVYLAFQMDEENLSSGPILVIEPTIGEAYRWRILPAIASNAQTSSGDATKAPAVTHASFEETAASAKDTDRKPDRIEKVAGFEIYIGPKPYQVYMSEGGVRALFLAKNPSIKKDLVAKIVLIPMVDGDDENARLRREVELLRKLEETYNGNCFPRVYWTGPLSGECFGSQSKTVLCAIEEYVHGERLDDLVEQDLLMTFLKRSESGKTNELLRIVREIIAAISMMHKLNFLHLDIKPSNIRVRPDGSVVILDLGISRDLQLMTKKDLIMGTPFYSPNRQLTLGRDKTDKWMDVYSIGATAYTCLTGSFIPQKDPDMVNEACKEMRKNRVPEEIISLVAKCLDEEKTEICDAQKLLEEFDRAVQAFRTRDEQTRRKKRVRTLAVVGASIIAVGAISFLLVDNPFRSGDNKTASQPQTTPEVLASNGKNASSEPKRNPDESKTVNQKQQPEAQPNTVPTEEEVRKNLLKNNEAAFQTSFRKVMAELDFRQASSLIRENEKLLTESEIYREEKGEFEKLLSGETSALKKDSAAAIAAAGLGTRGTSFEKTYKGGGNLIGGSADYWKATDNVEADLVDEGLFLKRSNINKDATAEVVRSTHPLESCKAIHLVLTPSAEDPKALTAENPLERPMVGLFFSPQAGTSVEVNSIDLVNMLPDRAVMQLDKNTKRIENVCLFNQQVDIRLIVNNDIAYVYLNEKFVGFTMKPASFHIRLSLAGVRLSKCMVFTTVNGTEK